ncbi:MAG: PD-(D/E)XK nuclease family protein, partial [Polaribacter sp.]
AINYGNLLHEMLSKINTKKDVEAVVEQYYRQGILDSQKSGTIKKILFEVVTNSAVSKYFSENNIIFNEREIVTQDNQIIIPDRLVFMNDEVVIIDYKTGKPLKEHRQQILRYEQVLESMHYKVKKKVLLYINKQILVEEV